MRDRPPSLLWFRQDLRLTDNPALSAAVSGEGPVIPVYIWAPEEEGDWPPGGASKWWLAQSLAALNAALDRRGSRLIVRRGPSQQTLLELAKETGAKAVYWNRRYEPAAVGRDGEIKSQLREQQLKAESFNSNLLFEPWTIRNQSGQPFRVFTPFWRTCLKTSLPPISAGDSERFAAPEKWPASLDLSDLGLMPRVDWAAGFRELWQPGEKGALRQLDRFHEEGLARYPVQRDRPDTTGTSRLSPHLHFGEIGPGQVWRAIQNSPGGRGTAGEAFLRQLAWREFGYHLLYHFPESTGKPLRPEFANFPWKDQPQLFRTWQRGRTGYPLVDAGMRELWHRGWMHNRVRMVAASFLVKHLLISWQQGAEWFWDTLVDADLANNTLGWQWVAGCGADAAPYFRIFNPTAQAAKFDPDGDYVRKWVPEANHASKYPRPIVDHNEARGRALDAFATIKRS